MNHLDLGELFYHLRDDAYAVIKSTDATAYAVGGDLDLFCYSAASTAKKIVEGLSPLLREEDELLVREKSDAHIQVDFNTEGALEIRFDLYSALPSYKKIHLKEHFVFSVVENAKKVRSTRNEEAYFIKYASPIDDLILRYVEYIEWYELRPDKVKHLDFIVEAFESSDQRQKMLDKLHAYTAFPSEADAAPPILKTWTKRARKAAEQIRYMDRGDLSSAMEHAHFYLKKVAKSAARKIRKQRESV